MKTNIILGSTFAAFFVAAPLTLDAQAQESRAPSSGGLVTPAAVNESALSALPPAVQAVVLPALQSGNMDTIATAISAVVAANPDLAVEIASLAAQAFPAAASTIAGAATAAVIASGQGPVGVVVAIAQAVAGAAPAAVAQIAIAVYQNLPAILQDAANLSLIATAVSSVAVGANLAATLVAVVQAMESASPSNSDALSTPIVVQQTVSRI